ncbi:mechanosensitive ion channel family protein [Methanofollis tationis]|uniref:Mechanosensitive ion channel family protein n=1 Tax=Methanofollis tationis TaxID=81417 RepID=A0A7K4HRT3_9EURY|nr:mechanosensitive ion channel family protein [Methanofollis tationis]NVO67961.1 mechanosensitive ion channel family protein [Methanofollis tationis]
MDGLNFSLNAPVTSISAITWGHLIYVCLVVIAAAVVSRVLMIYLKKSLTDKIKRNQLDILMRAVKYGIAVVAFLVILPYFEVNLSGLLVAGGFASIVIGFASQSVIGNMISGLFLIIERPVSIGDNINIGSATGTVTDINIFSTIIKTYEGIYVRIPNETVFTSPITNYVAHVARRFEYTVGIPYAADATVAVRIIKEVIRDHPLALREPVPSVYVDELGDNAVAVKVRVWAPSSEWWDVRTELLWTIKTELEKNGIEIPFPQREVWFRNELAGRVSVREERPSSLTPAGDRDETI